MNSPKITIVSVASLLCLVFCCLTHADENDLVWSTFLGESGGESGRDIAVDGSGNAYVTGVTSSSDFPTTTGAFDTTYYHSCDVFVTKFNATGNALNYSTFLGGHEYENAYCIAVDGSGNAYLTGRTSSPDFPTTSGAFDTTYNYGGFFHGDAFVVKLNPSGGGLEYATFLGGEEGWDGGYSIAVDGGGNTYVTGRTASADFPTTLGAFDETFNGEQDAFVVKLNAAGSTLDYATFLGGVYSDVARGIALDDSGCAYVTGGTVSIDFPITAGAFDTALVGFSSEGFVAKLNATGNDLHYATFLGGLQPDEPHGIALDDSGCAYVTGGTNSIDFPTTTGAFDSTINGSRDIFVTKLSPTANSIIYSTFLGGSASEIGYAIALDQFGSAYLIGETRSVDFPVSPEAFDATYNAHFDAYVLKLNATGSAVIYATFLGGNDDDDGYGIAVDDSGNVFVTGSTPSIDFPTTPGAFDETLNGGDAFVAKFDLSGYPVPVVLTSFQATSGQGFISLDWVTASEINCHRWEIYRGDQEDGDYVKIGELPGHGSTETPHTYRWIDRHIRPQVTYYYQLKQVNLDGSSWWSDIVSATASSVVPKSYALHQNYPNPFNISTEIRYQIANGGHVTLKIFNTLGQEVRTLVDTDQKTGDYSVSWDGRDASSREVASGLYLCQLKIADFTAVKKMVLLK